MEHETKQQKILVGVDGSETATTALGWALSLAQSLKDEGGRAEVTVMHVWQPPATFGVESLGMLTLAHWEASARRLFEQSIAEVAGADQCESVLRQGRPASTLLAAASERNADLIVVGTRGAGWIERLILGSVSRRLVSNDRTPVAVVPPDAPPLGEPTIVGFDSSEGAFAALQWAATFCPGEIHALNGWTVPPEVAREPCADITRIERAANAMLISGVTEAMGGSIPERILPIARHGDPRTLLAGGSGGAQVVMGSRSRVGLRGALAGSVATFVAAHNSVTTIVVPPT